MTKGITYILLWMNIILVGNLYRLEVEREREAAARSYFSFRVERQLRELQAELRSMEEGATQDSMRVALLVEREELILDLLVATGRSGWWSLEARRKLRRISDNNQRKEMLP